MPQRHRGPAPKRVLNKHAGQYTEGQEAKTKNYKITRQSQVKFKGKEHSKNTETKLGHWHKDKKNTRYKTEVETMKHSCNCIQRKESRTEAFFEYRVYVRCFL